MLVLRLQVQSFSLSDEALNQNPLIVFMDKLLTRTYSDKAGDFAVPNVLSPRDLFFRPDLSDILKLDHQCQFRRNFNVTLVWLKYSYFREKPPWCTLLPTSNWSLFKLIFSDQDLIKLK